MTSVTATPDPTTGTVLIQVEQTIARDQFTRVVANGWGVATSGQAWTVTGGAAANYSVTGTEAQVSNASVNVERLTFINAGFPDHDSRILWRSATTATPAGGNHEAGVTARYTDASNYYSANIVITPANVTTLVLRKRVLGVNTDLASVVIPGTHSTGTLYQMRISVCGNTIKAKGWLFLQSQPDWMLTVTDFDLTTGNNTGSRSFLTSTVSNPLPVNWQFDEFITIHNESLNLYRVVDSDRTLVAGSPFGTNAPTSGGNTATATLWDGSAPLDTTMSYEMTTVCSSTTIGSSADITLDSDGSGWLRDPFDPTLNLRIEMDGFFDDCIDQDRIVFGGLGNPEYANASGVFDLVNSPRPNTVSMLRKRYASSLTLTSFSLDDVLDLEDIFASGRILLLSLPADYGWAIREGGTDYITCGDITQEYLGVDQRVVARTWTIPFRLSNPPATLPGGDGGNGIGGGGATYDDLAASALGTTYNSLTASALTYDQVAAGTGY